ncbi:two component transcriptional regulator [Burkholderiales bacterium GJ-E10]|nr:two component transcriptional regulator [Burkholderiales bacterium GJ-E10]
MKILLLEDDIDLGQAVNDHLEAAGHEVHWCKLVAQARRVVDPDLALLDLNLPDGDGLSLLREWRAAGNRRPVIVLTARDQVSDRIRGLQAGADDYLVKPFDLDELLARISAVTRRTAPPAQLKIGGVAIDLNSRSARRGSERVEFTAMEWSVLSLLARHPGRIYSRTEIETHLADEGMGDADSNSLEVIVSRLRKKLGPLAISTHRGLGYRLDV